MNTTKLKLTNPTDDELSAAVAEHVAGHKKLIVFGWGDVPMWCRDNGRPILEYSSTFEGDSIESRWVPAYATCADAVLPLLDSPKYIAWWEARLKLNGTHQVRCHQSEVDSFLAESATFPRAACIALLRANGIEVEQTAQPTRASS